MIFRMACMVLLSLISISFAAADQGDAGTAGGTLIVLNKSEASASLLDIVSGKELVKIPTGAGPHEVAVSPDGKIAVVANYGGKKPGSSLTVIDMTKCTAGQTIDLEKYHRPHGICFLPDGKHVVVTAEQEKCLLVVDVTTGKIVYRIGTEQNISHMVAVHPEGNRAFVASIGSGSVSVINLEKAELIKIIPTGAGAEGIDISPDGREVWVSNREADNIKVIDAEKLEITGTLECHSFPIRVKFTPDGRHVLVSNARSGDVAVFDAKTRKELQRIKMGATPVETKDRLFGDRFGKSPVPVGILMAPDGKQAYVANTNADLVTVIDLDTWKITNRLTAGKEPDGLGYSPIVSCR